MVTEEQISIDSVEIPFHAGETIMQAAYNAGIYIPHLCYRPGLSVHGSCRMCLVHVNGHEKAACTTPAATGQQIGNCSEALRQQRLLLIKMLFVEGNHICPACEQSGRCELQALAYDLGMTAPDLPHFQPKRTVDASHQEVNIDHNRCIACAQCVRAGDEIDGSHAFALSGRGIQTRLIPNAPSGRFADTAIHASDAAVAACPVGTLLPKHRGFNIPIGQRIYDRKPIHKLAMEKGYIHHDDTAGKS